MNDFPTLEELNSDSKRTKRYLNKHYPTFVQFLQKRYPFCETLNESLYVYFNSPSILHRPLCPVCGKPVKYYPSKGYTMYCGAACSARDPRKQDKIKSTMMDKYGVDNASKLEEAKEKKKQTCLKKYGVEHYTNKEQFKHTMMDRYGVDNASKSKIFINKAILTKSKHTDEQRLLTQQRFKKTCEERYGIEQYKNPGQRKQTNIQRYGDENYNNIEKSIQTCLDRYGVRRPVQSDVILEKFKQTCLDKYGVEYPCLRMECRGNNQNSGPNMEFASLLESHNISYEREFTIGKYAYDFKIGNALVEIDPTPTHNSTWGVYGESKKYDYHLKKSLLSRQHDYNCIHVWDWDDVYKVISLIQPRKTIYARKCIIKDVDKATCKQFLIDNHLQGTCNGQSIRIGLYYNNDLVGLMTFGKPRYNKHYEWELLRLCFKSDVRIIGGSQKMFNHFLQNYDGSIISYCDLSKFSGYVYEKLGFEIASAPMPSKHWYNIKTGMHITNNLLLQRGYDQIFKTDYGKGTSNEELMKNNGFVEIYDCGQATYVYKKRNS